MRLSHNMSFCDEIDGNKKRIHAEFDEILDGTYVLDRPMGPSRWVSKKVTKKEVTRLVFNTSWVYSEIIIKGNMLEYVRDFDMLECERWDGKKMIVNMKSVKNAEVFDLVSAELDSQNPYFPLGIHKYYMLAEKGTKITLKE